MAFGNEQKRLPFRSLFFDLRVRIALEGLDFVLAETGGVGDDANIHAIRL